MVSRNKTIRVLLCNKHNLFREGIKALFREPTSIEIVGEAATGEQALNLLEGLRPDVVLLDVTTDDSSGSEITRRIKAVDSQIVILILSLDDDELLIADCLDAGATGYIRKDDEALQLRRAINTACKGIRHAA